MNAIALLKTDHRAVEELFDKLDQLDGKSRGKKTLVEKLIRELSIHAAIEEEIFYPEVKRSVPGGAEIVYESLEEHGVVKWELSALQSMDLTDERFDAKLKVLKDTLLHHIDEEENELFPMVRDAFEASKLNELGASLERAKKTAPTRPHPRAPDEPPANIIANAGASVVDRARDAGRAMVRGRTPAKRARPKRARAAATRSTGASRSSRASR
ncbi:MAG TPA: hemerythrin domain-containing protein [Polyangiaceae bacterium]|nr:hemerythrin domain-containing protein [Polyangiaceae bacterium]